MYLIFSTIFVCINIMKNSIRGVIKRIYTTNPEKYPELIIVVETKADGNENDTDVLYAATVKKSLHDVVNSNFAEGMKVEISLSVFSKHWEKSDQYFHKMYLDRIKEIK